MSLYFESSKFLAQSGSSLKSRVFAEKNIKSQPAQIYALVVETKKWAPVLKEVIENSSLLSLERKLTPELALLLVHDLLFSRRGISAPASHKLRVAVEKNKARLQAELTKSRLRRKCASLDDLKQHIASANGSDSAGKAAFNHARWVRINRLKSTLAEQLSTTFADYEQETDLQIVLGSRADRPKRKLLIDNHIPDLIALPPSTDLSKIPAYLEGKIIIQDKASCFPAYLLDPRPRDGIVVDGCAAPGNKTTHLASLRYTASQHAKDCQIVACERDKPRAGILRKMISTAGADNLVTVKAGQDFLRSDPLSEPWSNVGALLLDPSCSGSGIVGRDEETEAVVLPRIPADAAALSKKRKRGDTAQDAKKADEPAEQTAEERPEESISKERLRQLSAFQAKLVLHALKFPKAHRVTYSTCSIHDEENEHVVATVLSSDIAREGRWRILRRQEQVDGMKRWHLRGRASNGESIEVSAEVAEACIRCEKHTVDGTQGFFVAAFTRDVLTESSDSADEDTWSGFDD